MRKGNSVKYHIQFYTMARQAQLTAGHGQHTKMLCKVLNRVNTVVWGLFLIKIITFIDLEHCRSDNGVLTPLAENIIDNFKDTFIEVSQSGNGLHIFALGMVKKAVKTKEIELYSTGRYAALTGNAVNPADLKFVNMLTFWCGCSEGIMRNIFRSSGMYRNERKMNLAIKKAIADCHTVYRGGGGM